MRSHKIYSALTLVLGAALPLFALPVARAQVGGVAAVSDAPNVPDKGLSLGHVPDLEDLTPRVRDIERRGLVARSPSGIPISASDWMNQSIKWLKAEDFAKAADGFRHAEAIYEQRGQPQDALVMSTYAARCETRVGIFYDRAPHVEMLREKMTTGRRLEPIYGAYVGAFIDHEQGVGTSFNDEDQSTGRPHRDVAEFDEKIGKKHAAFFTYCGYKSGLPDKWFANLKENGAAAQWAIEPNNLEEIQDDDWLRGLAHAAADSGVPVFVRFASEMNGDWTPYHSPSTLYREKFRLVARVFHEIAPNVAMVWCPNEIPQSNIPDYYPGDDAVDWVGVNFYSVYYNNGDATRPVSWCNPADKLDYVYQHYASRHPIMICEWAATHHEIADGVDRPTFAAEKIAQLYSSLPRRYPRIKAVFWLDMNAIEYANDPKTRKNDYSLLPAAQVANAYRKMISAPYFLEHVSGDALASREIAALADHTPLSGAVTLSAYVKSYDQRPTVIWSVNGRQVQSSTDPGAYECTLNTGALPNGPARISVTVIDGKGRVAGKQLATVVIQNNGAAAAHPTQLTTPTPIVVATPVVAPPVVPLVAPPPVTPDAPAVPAAAPIALSEALVTATTESGTLSLDLTPAGGTVFLGGRANNGIRVTANVNGSSPSGESPTLVILLLHATDGDATVQALAPADATDGAIAEMAAVPGASLSVPKAAGRVLRPDAVGAYTVRAVLLPTREAAKSLLEALAGDQAPTWKHVLNTLHAVTVPGGGRVFVADKTVQVVDR